MHSGHLKITSPLKKNHLKLKSRCSAAHTVCCGSSGSGSAGMSVQMQPSPLKRSMSLIPACGSEWLSPSDELQQQGSRQAPAGPDHAPLSPQSSVASSGSEQTEEQGSARNTFQEDGSGMKGLGSCT